MIKIFDKRFFKVYKKNKNEIDGYILRKKINYRYKFGCNVYEAEGYLIFAAALVLFKRKIIAQEDEDGTICIYQSFNKRAAHKQADHGIKTIWYFTKKYLLRLSVRKRL